MGLSPTEVDRLSVWQFMAALDGFVQSKDPDGDKKLSSAEEDELWNWLKSKDS